MPVTLEQSEGQSVICAEGAVGIADAAELKRLLLQALQPGKEVRVSLERAVDLDVTAVQLLWAAGRAAKGADVEFTLVGTVPKEIFTALGDTGFEKFSVSK